MNDAIWKMYFNELLPLFTVDGDDGNYAETVALDFACLKVHVLCLLFLLDIPSIWSFFKKNINLVATRICSFNLSARESKICTNYCKLMVNCFQSVYICEMY